MLAFLLIGLLVIHCWNVDELGLNDIRTYSSDVENVCIPRPNGCWVQSSRIASFFGSEGAGTQTSLQWRLLSPSKVMNVGLLGTFIYVTLLCAHVLYSIWLMHYECGTEGAGSLLLCMVVVFRLWYVATFEVVHGQWNVGISKYKCRFLLWKVKTDGSEKTKTEMSQHCWWLLLLVMWCNIFSRVSIIIRGRAQCIGEDKCWKLIGLVNKLQCVLYKILEKLLVLHSWSCLNTVYWNSDAYLLCDFWIQSLFPLTRKMYQKYLFLVQGFLYHQG